MLGNNEPAWMYLTVGYLTVGYLTVGYLTVSYLTVSYLTVGYLTVSYPTVNVSVEINQSTDSSRPPCMTLWNIYKTYSRGFV